MGVQDLIQAFNSVSGNAVTCEKAYLSYERAGDVEWQVIEFTGRKADGTQFSVRSDRVRPQGDLAQAARDTAQRVVTG